MFLNKLDESEKKAFLKLAQYLIEANVSDGEKEKLIVIGYANEMGIEVEKFEKDKFNLNDIMALFKSNASKKIVLLEIMALIYADNQVDDEEENFIQEICKKFDISRKQAQIYEEWSKAILSLYKQGELFINV
jgi:uncharacterized tellurite resistance protein B-like protein